MHVRRLPTSIDRYPGKMNGRLAHLVATRYLQNAEQRVILDPFCGSGALLAACTGPDTRVVGVDVNPIAVLLASVRLLGFDASRLRECVRRLVALAKVASSENHVDWSNKEYWFTAGVLVKLERLRHAAMKMKPSVPDRDWLALLLCLAMVVRPCSRADQRSPKPFISSIARAERKGRHYCPYRQLSQTCEQLVSAHGESLNASGTAEVICGDVARDHIVANTTADYIVTSPPYLNAQDYFRNTKLELYVLEGLMPYRIEEVKDRFVGTERGNLEHGLSEGDWDYLREIVNDFAALEKKNPRLAKVAVRYFRDMGIVLDEAAWSLRSGRKFILICGDNLIGGLRVRTWKILHQMLLDRGFSLTGSFTDEIRDRMLPPSRKGHKGLIKEEVVSCYRKD